MMKQYCLIALMVLLSQSVVAAPITYICLIHGKPVYTTIKQDSSCQPSSINGISEAQPQSYIAPIHVASEVALPTETLSHATGSNHQHDPIAKIWYDYEYGSYDHTPILPPPPPHPVVIDPILSNQTNTHQPHHPAKTLPTMNRSSLTIPYKAPAVAILSRRQVLSQEIEREQAALKVAQLQLAHAKKRHDIANINRLNNVVRDREQNVQSLQRELER